MENLFVILKSFSSVIFAELVVRRERDVPGTTVPLDHGPIYAETNFLSYPVEPWNTYSLILFILIALYWLTVLFGRYARHKLLLAGNLILLLGTFGGMAYHACRCSNLWFLLDVIPILLIASLAAGYFWLKLRKLEKPLFLKAFSLLSFLAAAQVVLQFYLPQQASVCLFYLLLAVALLFPAFLLESKLHLGKAPLLTSVLLFGVAVCFRAVDFAEGVKSIFPMGTHFLWHIFGALAGHSLMVFLFRIGESEKNSGNDSPSTVDSPLSTKSKL